MRAPVLAVALLASAISWAQTLDIYVVDVEGGNDGAAAVRDANRILEALKDASLQKIDHLITTHWHSDHFGGMVELASKIKIAEFIDHGPNVQPGEAADTFLGKTYPPLYAQAKHTVAKAGDRISIAGLDVRVVTSAGQTIKTALPGADKANPYCADFKPGENNAEDPQSVGVYITFGKFRTAHLGDLTKNKEFELMCPANRLGTVDALHPRVAIMNDGTRKGGQPGVMKTLHSSPGLEDLWQLHFSLLSGQEYTVPGLFIANTIDAEQPVMPIAPGSATQAAPVHNGRAYWIKLAARQDGSFTVTNTRNGFSKTYQKGIQ